MSCKYLQTDKGIVVLVQIEKVGYRPWEWALLGLSLQSALLGPIPVKPMMAKGFIKCWEKNTIPNILSNYTKKIRAHLYI